jgi:hypothetical protein
MQKLCTGLVLALVGGTLFAGCGGGKSTSSSTQAGSAGSHASGASGGHSTSTQAGTERPLTPKQRIEVCQRAIRAPSLLTAAQKERLLKTCEKTGGTTGAQRQVVYEVCLDLAARLPAGEGRLRVLATCNHYR